MGGKNSALSDIITYQILMILDNADFLRYCGGNFENGDR
jgi:hypothetical protein